MGRNFFKEPSSESKLEFFDHEIELLHQQKDFELGKTISSRDVDKVNDEFNKKIEIAEHRRKALFERMALRQEQRIPWWKDRVLIGALVGSLVTLVVGLLTSVFNRK